MSDEKNTRKKSGGKNRILPLLSKNLKSMFRDKGNMAWIILYPLFFILIFGVAGIIVGPILLSITITLIKDLKEFHIIE